MESPNSTLFPAATSQQRSDTTNGRNKVALKPGRSLMDWVRLGQKNTDLGGVGGKLRDVTPHELAMHKTKRDCWTALSGKVYNITPYLEYHPGGEDELLRAAGLDGTRLFNEVHKWVNFESMLQKCLVGRLVSAASGATAPTYGNLLTASRALPADRGFAVPPAGIAASLAQDTSALHAGTVRDASTKPVGSASRSGSVMTSEGASGLPKALYQSPLPPAVQGSTVSTKQPRFDFHETDCDVTLAIDPRVSGTGIHDVLIGPSPENDAAIKIFIHIARLHTYQLHFVPLWDIQDNIEVKLVESVGKIDIIMHKKEAGVRWPTHGHSLPGHNTLRSGELLELSWTCHASCVEDVTHDTSLYELKLPSRSYLNVPVGCHVRLHANIEDIEVTRCYTPVQSLSSCSTVSPRNLLLMVKIYEHGAVSRIVGQLKPGDTVRISGHAGSFGKDTASTWEPCTALLLLAAGTGFTPMVKVIAAALELKKRVHLIFFNKTEQDILWHDELADLVSESSELFKVTHVLSKASSLWVGESGHVRAELVSKSPLCSGQLDEVLACICGPTRFADEALKVLQSLHFTDRQVHTFTG